MGGFLGNYANLTGYQLGSFRISTLAGRDAAGAPKWEVICESCGSYQIVQHGKIAPLLESKTPENFHCNNGGCSLSRSQSNSGEAWNQFRRRERREAEEAARVAAESRRV